MARILAISSYVASGHVGLGAIVPALHALGHEVTAVPTIVLSNHPGHANVSGDRIPPESMTRTVEALAANGWLADIDRVLTGYLPSAAHVDAARRAVDAVIAARSQAAKRAPLVVCDPVLGDTPKGLYIDPEAAAALRDDLLPKADLTTPNTFELGWLSSCEIADDGEATAAARALKPDACLMTSLGVATDETIANALVIRGSADVHAVQSKRHTQVPNGTGDLLAALATGLLFDDASSTYRPERLTAIIATLDAIVAASVGRPELALVANLPRIRALEVQVSA